MKKILTTVFILSITIVSFAARDWRGKVVDQNGVALPYANVILLSQKDSSIISGTTTDENGNFLLSGNRKDVIVKFDLLGYDAKYLNPQENMTVTLMESPEYLEGATVKAVMPKVKLTGEGLQTSVRGSVLEDVGTAKDVLSRTPGIIKSKDGLEVLGKGAPLYYINGRKITDITELERLLSSDIQSIEVINNPGAQYDASVNAVVRIRTIRRDGEGFGFNAELVDEQSLRTARNNDPNLMFHGNYRYKNLDVFAGVDAGRATYAQNSVILQQTLDKPTYKQDGTTDSGYESWYGYFDAGANYQISDNHSVGLKVEWGTDFYDNTDQVLAESVYKDDVLIDKLTATGNTTNARIPSKLKTNLYYSGTAGKLGIDFNFDYYNRNIETQVHTYEKSEMTSDATIDTRSDSNNNLYAAKLVFSYPIWKGKLQIGTEDSFSRRDEMYSITGASLPSSSSKVREDSYAAFASYGFALPKVGQFNAGLRYEYIYYKYDDLLGEADFDKKYSNVYPSVSYSGTFGPVQVMASFAQKTKRPSYYVLSNSIEYASRYVLQSGNAALQPQMTTAVNATAVWKFISLMANYNRVDNVIMSWSSRYNDEGVIMIKPVNLTTEPVDKGPYIDKPYRYMSVYANFSPTIGVWTMNYTLGMVAQWLTINAPDSREATGYRSISFSDKPMFFAQLYNTFTAKKGWSFEIGGELQSSGYYQNIEMVNTYFNLTAAIQKSLLKDGSLVLRLEGNDLAGLGYWNARTDSGAHVISQSNQFDFTRIKFSIRYKFNNAASKYKGGGAGKDASERMGSQSKK